VKSELTWMGVKGKQLGELNKLSLCLFVVE